MQGESDLQKQPHPTITPILRERYSLCLKGSKRTSHCGIRVDVIVKNPDVARDLRWLTCHCGKSMDTVKIHEATRIIGHLHTLSEPFERGVTVSIKLRCKLVSLLRINHGRSMMCKIGRGVTAENPWTIGSFSPDISDERSPKKFGNLSTRDCGKPMDNRYG